MHVELTLIGMGTGHPDHMTRQGVLALQAADLVLLPRKGEEKAALATVRQQICEQWLSGSATQLAWFDMPERQAAQALPDYRLVVQRWHDAIADAWHEALCRHLPSGGRVAMLVWGDPSLYDSTLRIAQRLSQRLSLRTRVIPGITALQALTAAHAVALNEINEPVFITTGRWLRDHGWPQQADTVAVMLDGQASFLTLPAQDITIWWGAYLGMPHELLVHGSLADVGPAIALQRQQARARHGWIMDTYLMRRARANLCDPRPIEPQEKTWSS
jgi:precorrin-6A synthase